MKTITLNDYLFFGTVIRYLQDAVPHDILKKEGGIYDNIKDFFVRLDRYELLVSKRASYELVDIFNEFKNKDKNYEITEEESDNIREILTKIRHTIEAEAKGKIAYIISDKRIDINKLVDNVSSLFSPNIFINMQDIAKYDFVQAGKCIAFELPTAAAFHILRGTEDVLKQFYCHCVRKNRIKNLMWGPILDSLRKRKNPPPEVLLNNLDNIRYSFRNPTQHPEKIYDIQEVQDLFSLCIDVVNRMINIILAKS